MRRLKVIPEDRKKPWSSSNFFRTVKRKRIFLLTVIFQPIFSFPGFSYFFLFHSIRSVLISRRLRISLRVIIPTTFPSLTTKDNGGHPIFFLSREKVRENKILKNNKLKTGPIFRNTPPFESVYGFLLGFDESLANNEL